MASFATCRSALFAPLLSLLLAAVALAQQRVCPISDLDQFNNIARVCCEGSTGAADCSAGFPATCTRACAELLEPFWTSCGPLSSYLRSTRGGPANALSSAARDHKQSLAQALNSGRPEPVS